MLPPTHRKKERRSHVKEEEEAKAKAEEEAKAKKQALKVVGHIDLDAPKKKAEPAVEEKKQVEEPVAEPVKVEQPATDEPQIITDGKVTGTLENGVFRLNPAAQRRTEGAGPHRPGCTEPEHPSQEEI